MDGFDLSETLKRIAFAFEIAFLGYVVGMMHGFDKARLTALEESQESPCAKRAREARERKDES